VKPGLNFTNGATRWPVKVQRVFCCIINESILQLKIEEIPS